MKIRTPGVVLLAAALTVASLPLTAFGGSTPHAATSPKSIVCSISDQRLYFFEGDQLVNILRCSTGLNDSTPTGNFSILNHHLTHGVIWGGVCDYWMGFTSSHGIHAWPRGAGNDYEERLGAPASPGCIVLHPQESSWPYCWAPDGTTLSVTRASLFARTISGCHASAGVCEPSPDWYFAEGYTAGDFDTYLLLGNPGEEEVNASVFFYPEDGGVVHYSYALPAHTRFTLPVDGLPEMTAQAFATQVHASGPIVAERAMYFSRGGVDGGHVSLGTPQLCGEWYFAEGCTAEYFDTYLLLGNPGEDDALVEVMYCTNEDSVSHSYVVGAHKRVTVDVKAQPALERGDVSFTLHSSLPLVAERALYYGPYSHGGGHDVMGEPAASTRWYFAEGYTDEAFDTFLLLSNPGNDDARVVAEFMGQDGSVHGCECVVRAHRRATIHVDELPGLDRAAFSMQVHSDFPVISERAMYFVMGRN